ncbi:MAG: EAL domain-containing protein [Fibrobacteres bacterium]|nr:EAL domain-containing protein [Fibrobacterota bacterium]
MPSKDRAIAATSRDPATAIPDWRPGPDGSAANGSAPGAAALAGLLAAAQEALRESEERHRRVSEELRHRIRFEDLITSISTHFIHLPGDRIDMGINYGLRALAEFAQVDRSYIFLFSPDGSRVDNAYEWCARGIAPQIKRLQGLEASRFPWFMERILALRTVHVSDLSELPPEAAAEREEFEREGIRSLVIVPMAHRGSVRGYLGFDSVRVRQDWTEANIQVLRMAGEIFVSALERKRVDHALSEAKARYLNIFENAVEGIFQSTAEGRFLGANPALARLLGYADAREMIGSVQDIGTELYVDPSRRAEFLRTLGERGRVTEFESQARRKDGTVIIISENARAVAKADGSLDYCEGTVMDVTQRKRMEEQLIHESLHDTLTGLPNRVLLLERLGRAIERARRNPGAPCAVLALDLDRFKFINDSMGHSQGDRLLTAFSRRLEAILPEGTTLARLGGDEFCVLLEDLSDVKLAPALADRVLEALSLPFDIEGREIYAAASIGIAFAGDSAAAPGELLRAADTAMHRAKAAGKGRYEVFDASMHAKAVRIMTLENNLRKALERSEFRLHYQPIVSLVNRHLMGFEALIRWQHPELGMVSPADFIPLAEDTGLIISIGRWVLWQSLRQLAEWQRVFADGKHLTMSVNLSGKQLQDPDLLRQIQGILKEAGVEPGSLKLEVTESAIMENPEQAAAILTGLRDMGVQLSLDDFGTGYSSLSYLHRFPFHDLKIDRSFVSKLEAGDKDAEIVKVINSLAKNLGMDVVAEGIETEAQWSLLHDLACRYGQGYYFSKPLEGSAASKLIESGGFPARGPQMPPIPALPPAVGL